MPVEDAPRTPDGHVDFGKLLEGLTLQDLAADGSVSLSETIAELVAEGVPVEDIVGNEGDAGCAASDCR